MNIDTSKWFLDFSQSGQMWHHDLVRVPENQEWVNIGYGSKMVLDHFCNTVDVLTREFGMKFSTEQIIRLAECTPGLTVFNPTPLPEDSFECEVHNRPIYSRECIEKEIGWKPADDK